MAVMPEVGTSSPIDNSSSTALRALPVAGRPHPLNSRAGERADGFAGREARRLPSSIRQIRT